MLAAMVAVSKNGVIGKDNALPWHYKRDLQYFKEVTYGHTVLMGRKTFDSIINKLGTPLPGRKNVVVTNNPTFSYPDVEVVLDLKEYIRLHQDTKEEIFVIDGAQIFLETLKACDRLYITHIDKAYEGDVFFPNIDLSLYKIVKQESEDVLNFVVYEKVK